MQKGKIQPEEVSFSLQSHILQSESRFGNLPNLSFFYLVSQNAHDRIPQRALGGGLPGPHGRFSTRFFFPGESCLTL